MKRWAILMALVTAAILPRPVVAADVRSVIQPGARLTRPDIEPAGNALPYKFYRCTMTFIFRDDAGARYTGSTGESECVQDVGARAYDSNGVAFGTAVFREYAPPAGSFTLIRIDDDREVNPSVLGWGGPTGVASAEDVAPGDLLLFTGHGFVEGDAAATESRLGVLQSHDASHFVAASLAELGDSGAPVINEANGLAVGMISDFGIDDSPPATDDGPSILRILADASAQGFDLQLVTAPYAAPF